MEKNKKEGLLFAKSIAWGFALPGYPNDKESTKLKAKHILELLGVEEGYNLLDVISYNDADMIGIRYNYPKAENLTEVEFDMHISWDWSEETMTIWLTTDQYIGTGEEACMETLTLFREIESYKEKQ